MIIVIFKVYYETFVDISPGEELTLVAKEPLNLRDMFADSTTSDDRSDKETGMLQHALILNFEPFEVINGTRQSHPVLPAERNQIYPNSNQLSPIIVSSGVKTAHAGYGQLFRSRCPCGRNQNIIGEVVLIIE